MLKTAFILFLLILFPIIGVGVVISSIGMLKTANVAQEWPTVRGKILSSQVVTELSSDWGSPGNSKQQPIEVYSAQVHYEYSVDGKTYIGERISFENGPSTDRYQAELTAEKFCKGETTVYYNPEDPQDALLSPQEKGGIIIGMFFGAVLMIVPTALILVGLRYEFIPRPELPTHIQLWWDLKFGKYRKLDSDEVKIESSTKPESFTDESPSTDDRAPVEGDFIEKIVTWNPKIKVELSSYPDAIWMYLVTSAVVGLILAWVTMFPVTHFIYRRNAPHLPELVSVFSLILVTTSALMFFISRYWDRGSTIVIDWESYLIRAKREFSFPRQYSISDVQRVVIRCLPIKGRRTKFRAVVELDVVGENVKAACTREPRRKPESAREKASNLAEPLADALGVPVEFVGW